MKIEKIILLAGLLILIVLGVGCAAPPMATTQRDILYKKTACGEVTYRDLSTEQRPKDVPSALPNWNPVTGQSEVAAGAGQRRVAIIGAAYSQSASYDVPVHIPQGTGWWLDRPIGVPGYQSHINGYSTAWPGQPGPSRGDWQPGVPSTWPRGVSRGY